MLALAKLLKWDVSDVMWFDDIDNGCGATLLQFRGDGWYTCEDATMPLQATDDEVTGVCRDAYFYMTYHLDVTEYPCTPMRHNPHSDVPNELQDRHSPQELLIMAQACKAGLLDRTLLLTPNKPAIDLALQATQS